VIGDVVGRSRRSGEETFRAAVRSRWEGAFCALALLYVSGAVGACVAHPELRPRAARLFDVAAGAPALLVLFVLAWRQRRLMDLRRDGCLLCLLLMALSSTLWSVSIATSLLGGLRLCAVTVLAVYVARRFALHDTLRVVIAALAGMLLISEVFVLVRPSLGAMALPVGPSAWRGVFHDKNALGWVAALSLVSGTFGLFVTRLRRWAACLLLLALPALVLSRSAGALLTVGGALGVTMAIALRQRLRSTPSRIAWWGVALVLAALLGSTAGSRLLIRLLNRDMTLTTRAEIWMATLPWVLERPWLGHGYHAFWLVAQRPVRERLLVTPDDVLPVDYPGHAHNGLLETAGDLGGVGVLLLGVVITVGTVRALCYAGDSAISYWPLAVVVATVLHDLVETSFLQTSGAAGVGWIVFLIAVSGAAAGRSAAGGLPLNTSEHVAAT